MDNFIAGFQWTLGIGSGVFVWLIILSLLASSSKN